MKEIVKVVQVRDECTERQIVDMPVPLCQEGFVEGMRVIPQEHIAKRMFDRCADHERVLRKANRGHAGFPAARDGHECVSERIVEHIVDESGAVHITGACVLQCRDDEVSFERTVDRI